MLQKAIAVENLFNSESISVPAFNLKDIAFENELYGIAIIDNGNCIITSDSGKTWSLAYTLNNPIQLNSIFIFNNGWYIATGNGNLLKSIDKGNTWNELTLTEKQRQELILLSKLTGEIDNSKTQLPTKITQSFKHEVLGQATAMATRGKVSSGLAKIANDILKWIKETLSKIGFKNVNTIKTFKDLKQVFEDNNVKIDLNQSTEIKPKIDSSKKISAKGKMTFSYGNNKRNDVKSITTFEAIKNGERTATTRYESDGHIDYWKNLKEGDIIEWESANGEKDMTYVEQKLSDDAQRVIIIDLYKQQSLITSRIKSAGNIVNMFKRINPNFYSFDKIKKDIKDLKNGNSIVEDEVSNRIFDKNQVWSVIDRLVDQIDEKSKMFIERSAPFIPIRNAFEGIFKDSDNFAKVVTSYIGLKKLKLSYISDILKSPGYENLSEATKKLKKQEDILIQQMFTADYWFTNNLEEELTLMQRKYPDNELLKRLRILKTEKGAVDTDMSFYDEKFISVVGKAKISGKLQENIENDADNLSVAEPLFFKKMFFHDLVRTGLRPRDGSYLQYLNPDYKLPISKYIDEFLLNRYLFFF